MNVDPVDAEQVLGRHPRHSRRTATGSPQERESPVLRYFGSPVLLTVAALVAAILFGGPAGLLAVAVLGILEVCLSFDNAVVNAKVLKHMSPLWRQLFLYVGIFIAVFVMRAFLPLLLVSVTADLSLSAVYDLALNDADAYARHVENASEAIYTFGGV